MSEPYDIFGHRVQILSEHYRIHAGEMFRTGFSWTVASSAGSTDIAVGASGVITLQAGAGMHLVAEYSGVNQFLFSLYKGVTLSTAGSSLAAINMNDNSDKASAATLLYGTTTIVTDFGTRVFSQFIPSILAKGDFSQEFITKSTGIYALRLHNLATSANQGTINMLWYEPGATS
jgi:hypothetical protein